MVDELFEYYKTHLTFNSQISRCSKIKNYTVAVFILIIYIISFYKIIFERSLLSALLIVSVLLILILLYIVLTGNYIKNNNPKFYIQKPNSKEFKKKVYKLLSDKLNESNIDIDLLQQQIKKNADKEKTSLIITATFSLALFVPVWGSYTSEIMKTANCDFNLLNSLLGMFTLIIISFSLLVYLFTILVDRFFTNYQKWSNLNDLITECRIRKTIGDKTKHTSKLG